MPVDPNHTTPREFNFKNHVDRREQAADKAKGMEPIPGFARSHPITRQRGAHQRQPSQEGKNDYGGCAPAAT